MINAARGVLGFLQTSQATWSSVDVLHVGLVKYRWHFTPGQKGLHDPMSAGNESSTAPPIIDDTCSLRRAQPTPYFDSGRTSKPLALGLIGLAIAVALWGFGYKLSRYNPSLSSRASFAKLWDKHHVAQVASGAKATAQSLKPGSALILVHYTPPLRPEAFCHRHECNRLSALIHSVIPLRSPPSRTLLA